MEIPDGVTQNMSESSTEYYYYYYEYFPYDPVNLYVLLLGVFGVVDNAFVVVIILGFTKLKNRITGLLILNQTLVDLVFSFSLIVVYSVFYAYDFPLMEQWKEVWSEIFCRLFYNEWLGWGLMLSSTFNLIVFNLERYLSVVHPVFHKGLNKKNFAYPALGFVWLSGPIFALVWGVPSSYFEEGWCVPYEFKQKTVAMTYSITYVSLNYFIPLASMIYFYGHMIVVLGRSNFKKATDLVKGEEAKSKMSRSQKNLLKTSLLVTFAFVACMSWDAISWLLYTIGIGEDYDSDSYYYAYLLSSFNSCINPFIYIINYREFQTGMKKMLCIKRVRPADVEAKSDSTKRQTLTE